MIRWPKDVTTSFLYKFRCCAISQGCYKAVRPLKSAAGTVFAKSTGNKCFILHLQSAHVPSTTICPGFLHTL